jgi:hypothetical protein
VELYQLNHNSPIPSASSSHSAPPSFVDPIEYRRRCIAHLGMARRVETAAEGYDGLDSGGDPVAGVEREFDVGFIEVEAEKEGDDEAGEEQRRTPPHQTRSGSWLVAECFGRRCRPSTPTGEDKMQEKRNSP